MKKFKKYIKLYFTYAKLSLMSKFAYKANVIIGIISFLVTEGISLLTLYLMVSTVPNIEGYTMYDIGFLFGIANLALGLDHLFSDRLWTIAYREVSTGKVDHLFLRPLPTLFQVIASEVQLEAFGEIITAVALLIYCGLNVEVTVTFGGIFLLIVGIICAVFITTGFKIIVAGSAFKLKRSGPLLQFVYNFSRYAKYPIKIYPNFIKYILLFVVPLGLCLSMPFDNLFNPTYNPYYLSLFILGITAVFFTISLFVWKFFEKKYESTGT